jgi:hypothetical protein
MEAEGFRPARDVVRWNFQVVTGEESTKERAVEIGHKHGITFFPGG